MMVRFCTDARDRERWNTAVVSNAGVGGGFLQSWEWGMMQERYGRRVTRLLLSEEKQDVGVVLLIHMPLWKTSSFLFSPCGPVVKNSALIEQLTHTDAFKKIITSSKSIHWRMEPQQTWNPVSHFRRVRDVEPSSTLLLDVRPDADELLSQMKQKTRYNIRLAEKKGVRISFVTRDSRPNWQALGAKWWQLCQETNARHGIRSHPRRYYETMIAVLGNTGMLEVAEARHNNDLLAMNLLIRFNKTITYLHGTSTHRKKEFMAPYALQWASIQRAKHLGMHTYDFFGISPDDARDHPLAAVTRFKMGFGGTITHRPGTWDLPLRPLFYTVYRSMKSIKTIIRS